MKARGLLTGALGLALGVLAGLAVAGEPRPPAPVVVASAAVPLGKSDIAAVVRAELARQPAALVATAPAAWAADADSLAADDAEPLAVAADEGAPADEVAPELLAREVAASSVLDGALARGTWTDTDAAALREQLATLPAAQAMPFMIRMGDAINRGELAVVTDGMPL